MPPITEFTFIAMFFKPSGKFYASEELNASYEIDLNISSDYLKEEAIKKALKNHHLNNKMSAVVTENVNVPIMVPAKY